MKTALRLLLIASLLAPSWPGLAATCPTARNAVQDYFRAQAVCQPASFAGRPVTRRHIVFAIILTFAAALLPERARAQAPSTPSNATTGSVQTALLNLRQHPADPNAVKALATLIIADERLEGNLLVQIVRELKDAQIAGNRPWEVALRHVLEARIVRPQVSTVLLSTLADAPSQDVRDKVQDLFAIRLLLIEKEATQKTRFFTELRSARFGALIRSDELTVRYLERILRAAGEPAEVLRIPSSPYVEKLFPKELPNLNSVAAERGPDGTPILGERPPPSDRDKEEAREKAQTGATLAELKEMAADETVLEKLRHDPAALQALTRLIHHPNAEIYKTASLMLNDVWGLEPSLQPDCLAYAVGMGLIPADTFTSDFRMTGAQRRAIARRSMGQGLSTDADMSSADSSDAVLTVGVAAVTPGKMTVEVPVTLAVGSQAMSGNTLTITASQGATIKDIRIGDAAASAGKSVDSFKFDTEYNRWKIAVIGQGNAQPMMNGLEMIVTLDLKTPPPSRSRPPARRPTPATVYVLEAAGTTPAGSEAGISVAPAKHQFPRIAYLGRKIDSGKPAEREAAAHALVDAIAESIAPLTGEKVALDASFEEQLRSFKSSVLESLGQWAQEHSSDVRVADFLNRIRQEADAGRSLFSKWQDRAGTEFAAALNACDLDGDGKVTVADVNKAINMLLGRETCAANIVGPGQCTITMVQRVINSALSLTNACVTGTVTPHYVSLIWTASISSNVIGYNIYRATVSGGPYAKVNTTPRPGTAYDDFAVQNGVTYWYVATAVDSYGNESVYSNQSNPAAIPLASLQLPAAKTVQNASVAPSRRRSWAVLGSGA